MTLLRVTMWISQRPATISNYVSSALKHLYVSELMAALRLGLGVFQEVISNRFVLLFNTYSMHFISFVLL